MQQESRNSGASASLSASSPSFTSYSSENIASIAARVLHELNLSRDDPYDDDLYSSIYQNDAVEPNNDVESEFEFAVLCGEDTSSPISADEIFYNGQIKPSYPLFDTDLLYTDKYDVVPEKFTKTTSFRAPLRSLMMRDRGNDSVSSSSCSSDNADLEGVPPETYCVWAPKKDQQDSKTMKKKSNSTGSGAGSSKRWRFKDLLHRSNSDGKDSFVFLHHGKSNEKITAVNGKYTHNGGVKKMEETKKKSHLPYRQDLVGLFSNVNGLSKTISPF